MKKYISPLLLAIIMYSCTPKYECVTKKITTTAPTGDARSFFGYKLNDVAKFKTTDGDTVTMTCIKDTIHSFWSPTKSCDNNKCVCEETMYWSIKCNYKITKNIYNLDTLYAELNTIDNTKGSAIKYNKDQWDSFDYQINCNDGACFDLNVNGIQYKNVMKLKKQIDAYSANIVDTIYYTRNDGIIKFSFKNNVTEWYKL